MTEELKDCKDCMHYVPEGGLCSHPETYMKGFSQYRSLVNRRDFYKGKDITVSTYYCNSTAKYFEPKIATIESLQSRAKEQNEIIKAAQNELFLIDREMEKL